MTSRFVLLGPPVAWTIQGLVGWWLAARVCTSISPSAVRIGIVALSVAALVVSLRATATAYVVWRGRLTDELAQFVTAGELFVGAMFSIGIFWAGLTAFVHACGVVR